MKRARTNQERVADYLKFVGLGDNYGADPIGFLIHSHTELSRRDANGNVWTGRGKTPRWITRSGKPASHFRIGDGDVEAHR